MGSLLTVGEVHSTTKTLRACCEELGGLLGAGAELGEQVPLQSKGPWKSRFLLPHHLSLFRIDPAFCRLRGALLARGFLPSLYVEPPLSSVL